MLPPIDKLQHDFPALAAVGSCLSLTPWGHQVPAEPRWAPSSLTQSCCPRGSREEPATSRAPPPACASTRESRPTRFPATPPSVTSHSPPLSHTRPPESQRQ